MSRRKPASFLAPDWNAQKSGTVFFMKIKHLHKYDRVVTVPGPNRGRGRVSVEFMVSAGAGRHHG
jgi:hypothetical protein